jgi:hypothetical protein
MANGDDIRQSLAAAKDVCLASEAQAIFFRRRHQPRTDCTRQAALR